MWFRFVEPYLDSFGQFLMSRCVPGVCVYFGILRCFTGRRARAGRSLLYYDPGCFRHRCEVDDLRGSSAMLWDQIDQTLTHCDSNIPWRSQDSTDTTLPSMFSERSKNAMFDIIKDENAESMFYKCYFNNHFESTFPERYGDVPCFTMAFGHAPW